MSVAELITFQEASYGCANDSRWSMLFVFKKSESPSALIV